MKTFRIIALLIIGLGLLYGTTSCIVYTKHDNPGQHKGWYKNSNNSRHSQSTNRYKYENKHSKEAKQRK